MYGNIGQLEAVIDIASNDEVYRLTDWNERGQVRGLLYHNGVFTNYSYDGATGLLSGKSAASVGQQIQSLSYTWDIMGNLKTRSNQGKDEFQQGRNIRENYCYDGLNRLTRAYLNTLSGSCGSAPSTGYDYIYADYADSGNILAKGTRYAGNSGTTPSKGLYGYLYGKPDSGGQFTVAGPHAVVSAHAIRPGVGSDLTHYQYDDNGNMVSSSFGSMAERSIEYSTFDKPEKIIHNVIDSGMQGLHVVNIFTTEFAYGSSRNRYWRKDHDSASGKTVETLYLGGVERVVKDNKVVWKRYLGGVALYEVETDLNNVKLSGSSTSKTYIHKDHLGSPDLLTNDNGLVIETMSFDPWGQRSDPKNGKSYTLEEMYQRNSWLNALAGNTAYGAYHLADVKRTSRGFTGHEMLDEVGLIHMNGRIYDPVLGRFLQADPFVQAATNTQSYNRYSYVFNNPLSGTDPSGFISSFWGEVKQAAGAIAAVVAYYYCGPCSAEVWAWIAAASAMINGADINGVLVAAVSAYAGAHIGAGSFGGDLGTKVVLSVSLGGVTAAVSGGNIGNTMVSAGVGAYFGGAGWIGDNPMIRVGVAALVGGTQSELTGGKFKNGAGTAAFVALVQLGAVRSKMEEGVEEVGGYKIKSKVNGGIDNPEDSSFKVTIDQEGNRIIEGTVGITGNGNTEEQRQFLFDKVNGVHETKRFCFFFWCSKAPIKTITVKLMPHQGEGDADFLLVSREELKKGYGIDTDRRCVDACVVPYKNVGHINDFSLGRSKLLHEVFHVIGFRHRWRGLMHRNGGAFKNKDIEMLDETFGL